MILTIHQPEHLPWLGLLDKVSRADLFVVLDSVQYRKDYFQNRNRIRTADGWTWVTLPVSGRRRVPIGDIRVDADRRHRLRYLHLLDAHYCQAPYFDDYAATVRQLIDNDETSLVALNLAVWEFVAGELAIDTPRVLASELGIAGELSGTALLHAIATEVGADTYLSGPSGRDYLDPTPFDESGVAVDFHDFDHPVYRQLHEPFLPCMAVLDLLFNEGPRSGELLRDPGAATMKPFAAPPHGAAARARVRLGGG